MQVERVVSKCQWNMLIEHADWKCQMNMPIENVNWACQSEHASWTCWLKLQMNMPIGRANWTCNLKALIEHAKWKWQVNRQLEHANRKTHFFWLGSRWDNWQKSCAPVPGRPKAATFVLSGACSSGASMFLWCHPVPLMLTRSSDASLFLPC